MNVQRVTPILNVSSLEESFVWFEKLGWTKHWEYGDPPDFGAVLSGEAEIFLCQDCQGTREPVGPDHSWEAGGTWMTWWLESPADVDRVHALASRNGVVVSWPPTDMPWNVRECHIRHPDGHTMRVSAGIKDGR